MRRSPASEPLTAATAPHPTLSPGDVVEIECTDLIAKTGQGVGRADGMVVYVLGPLPGERARVRIDQVKARYAVGELLETLSWSRERVEPFCAVFGACGGCQLQHLAYPAQLRWKRDLVENALRRIGGIAEPRVAATIGMDVPRAYRNKMSLVVDRADGKPGFGFYAAGSHAVVPIETCPVVAPALDRCLAGLWEAAEDPAAVAAFAQARHAVVRNGRARGESVVSITTERPSPGLATAGAALARHLPGVVGIANSYEPSSENAILGRRQSTVYGHADIEETIAGIEFRVSAASFFQVNVEMVGKIFAYMAPYLGNLGRVVDLYCGAGTFAVLFATHGAQVFGIEENANAVREARANAARNGVEGRARFTAARVEVELRGRRGAEILAGATVAFLDPPRKGSDEATLEALASAGVPHIWYLSCNPATLARDLAHLRAAGYRLDSVQPFDMFPQTGHVEAFAALHRHDAAPVGFAARGWA